MLKTKTNDQFWLVTQPDHGQLAGALAAHWGNDSFQPLGNLSSVRNPSRLREQAVFAVAHHDNGWFEWEAEPKLSDSDRLPVDLADMVRDQQDGMNRWRIGLRRFPDAPYANLLISEHPRMMYGIHQMAGPEPGDIHPLFWKDRPEPLLPGSGESVKAFLAELHELQSAWKARIAADPETRDWIEPQTLKPHARMLQICDGLSLALTSSLIPARDGASRGLGQDVFELREVPKTSWEDRVTIEVRPAAPKCVVLDPYPFAFDPLPVRVPARGFHADDQNPATHQVRWYSTPPTMLEYWLGSSPLSFAQLR